MKLFKDILTKLVGAAEPVKALALGLKALADGTKDLANHVAIIAHNQEVHHNMIMQMWKTNQAILHKMAEGSVNTQMPDIDKPKQPKKEKAN